MTRLEYSGGAEPHRHRDRAIRTPSSSRTTAAARSAISQAIAPRRSTGSWSNSRRRLDPKKRLALVNEIDRKLQADGARPILGWGKQHWVHWPHVKNWVTHENSIYNISRRQDVWLDK